MHDKSLQKTNDKFALNVLYELEMFACKNKTKHYYQMLIR